MKNLSYTIFIFVNFIYINTFFGQNYKGLYVDGFNQILGINEKEDSLFNYINANNFNALTLYNLHQIDFSNTNEVQNLKNFISKAKNEFGVNEIVATAENFWFFNHKILPYQTSANNTEKFTGFNFEFEFWVPESVTGYYCSTYLQPNGYSCDEEGAFQFYLNELNLIYNLAQNYQISTEIYLGWFNQNQANLLKQKCDRILLSNYTQNPNNCFDYSLQRIQYLGNTSPSIDIITLFSGENEFLNSWLNSNNYDIDSCFNIFVNEFENNNSFWKEYVNIIGQQWFTYTELPYYLPNEQNFIDEFQKNKNHIINPIDKTILINNEDFDAVRLFNNLGEEIEIKFINNNEIDAKDLKCGIYFLKINHVTYKLIKL